MSDLIVRFLTRAGCHLCDDARPLVVEVAGEAGATLEEVDVDEDDTLLALYGMRIPVLLAPGDLVLAEGIIDDRQDLRLALQRLVAP